jgi:hypothetical protein
MKDLLAQQNQLQQEARKLLESTPLLAFLEKLGKPVQTGSSVTGLMVYPDIDFSVQNDTFDISDAISLTDKLFNDLRLSALKIADFRTETDKDAGYYIGFELSFNGKTWHIDATVSKEGPIITNPAELEGWINNMTEDQRLTILTLKKQLIDTKRYVGARSQPPYTFRSTHLYEGVLKAGARTIQELEDYYSR